MPTLRNTVIEHQKKGKKKKKKKEKKKGLLTFWPSITAAYTYNIIYIYIYMCVCVCVCVCVVCMIAREWVSEWVCSSDKTRQRHTYASKLQSKHMHLHTAYIYTHTHSQNISFDLRKDKTTHTDTQTHTCISFDTFSTKACITVRSGLKWIAASRPWRRKWRIRAAVMPSRLSWNPCWFAACNRRRRAPPPPYAEAEAKAEAKAENGHEYVWCVWWCEQ